MLNDASVSIITMDLLNVEKEVDFLMEHGIRKFHADFMDHSLVPRLGVSPELIMHLKNRYGKDGIEIDSHLMMRNPETLLSAISQYTDWVFFHYESQNDPMRMIQSIRRKCPDSRIGAAFNLFTDIPYNIGKYVDGIMMMGISPGVLDSRSYPEIVSEKLRLLPESFCISNENEGKRVFIDGSVNFRNIPQYTSISGAPITFICGSSTIYRGVGYGPERFSQMERNIEELEKCLTESAH